MLEAYKQKVAFASEDAYSLDGATTPTKAPEIGDAVGIIELGSIQLQQAVVEGVQPSQTAVGPGHVPGTAGLGQPGNSVVVGRRAAFGGVFGDLDAVRVGDRLVVTTTQGFVVYKVSSVNQRELLPPGTGRDARDGSGATSGNSAGNVATGAPGAAATSDPTEGTDPIDIDLLYGRTADSRLTLITSASGVPTNSTYATVVVAKMEGVPYQRTPQNGRSDAQSGVDGGTTAWASLALVAFAFAAAAGAAVALHRNSTPVVAYVLTTPPLICFTILGAETLARLLPAWM
jgi:sortase A